MGKRKLQAGQEDEAASNTEEEELDSEAESEDQDSSSDEDDEDVDDSEASEKRDSDDDDSVDEVVVDLEFFDPSERDFHGLKALLQHYLDGAPFNSSAMVDTIIQQSTVGTVVKNSEEDDPIAVVTVLNTQRYKDSPFMKEILDFLVSHSKDVSMSDQLKSAWVSKGTGLLVNERLMNCPPKLAPPLFQALMDEVQWGTEDEPTAEKRDSFKLSRYIICTRVYADMPNEAARPSKKKAKSASAGPKATTEPVIVYIRPEDEYLHQLSTDSHCFRIESKAIGKDELLPMRLVMLVDSKHMPAVQTKLNEVIGNMALGG